MDYFFYKEYDLIEDAPSKDTCNISEGLIDLGEIDIEP